MATGKKEIVVLRQAHTGALYVDGKKFTEGRHDQIDEVVALFTRGVKGSIEYRTVAIDSFPDVLKPPVKWPQRITLYVGTDKDSNWAKAEALGLEGDAAREFAYTALELKLTVDVDADGSVTLLAVQDVELLEDVQI